MMAINESTTMNCRTHGVIDTVGKKGNEKRIKPYVPIFSRTPARITEPAVGASTCASGNQVWNGNIGTLMANPTMKAQNTHFCRSIGQWYFINSRTLKVYTPVTEW